MEKEHKTAIDTGMIAYCGLYCGACRRYTSTKCPGCHDNAKATWCKVRSCCIENGISSCAECKTVGHSRCPHFNNFMSKLFGVLFNSDRNKCIERIKEIGSLAYSMEMAEKGAQTIKRR